MRKVMLISLLLVNSFVFAMSPALQPAWNSVLSIEYKIKNNEVTKEKALKDLGILRTKIDQIISNL